MENLLYRFVFILISRQDLIQGCYHWGFRYPSPVSANRYLFSPLWKLKIIHN